MFAISLSQLLSVIVFHNFSHPNKDEDSSVHCFQLPCFIRERSIPYCGAHYCAMPRRVERHGNMLWWSLGPVYHLRLMCHSVLACNYHFVLGRGTNLYWVVCVRLWQLRLYCCGVRRVPFGVHPLVLEWHTGLEPSNSARPVTCPVTSPVTSSVAN